MRWGASEGVDEGNDVGPPTGNEVKWMEEVRWRACERIGEGNGVGLCQPVNSNLEGGCMRWGGSEGVDGGNDVGLPTGNGATPAAPRPAS